MHRFEQLEVWKRGMALSSHLHRRARVSASGADRALWTQVARASASIPANIAEGAQRGSDREFARFLAIAMGSAAELESLLLLARDSGALPEPEARALADEAVSLRRMAAAVRVRALGLRRRN
jgi:four helix bundle protein